jgi:hypothetical protein
MPITANEVALTTYYPVPTVTSAANTRTGKVQWTVSLKDPGGSLSANKEMNDWVTELKNDNENNTTCCIQMSHAINMMFHLSDPSKMVGETIKNNWRSNKKIAVPAAANKYFYYIRAVNEMKAFLEETFEEGERISGDSDNTPRPYLEQVALLRGRTGIVVFMGQGKPAGVHTEIWARDNFHQSMMKGFFKSLELSAPVWFWEVGLPNRLPGRGHYDGP